MFYLLLLHYDDACASYTFPYNIYHIYKYKYVYIEHTIYTRTRKRKINWKLKAFRSPRVCIYRPGKVACVLLCAHKKQHDEFIIAIYIHMYIHTYTYKSNERFFLIYMKIENVLLELKKIRIYFLCLRTSTCANPFKA